MATTLTASNVEGAAGKWDPYYFKPFQLGGLADGVRSTDGNIYITQTNGSSAEVIYGACNSSYNCGFYYTLTFDDDSSIRYFYVTKYDLNDNEIDKIYASETGESDDGKWWRITARRTYTIDIGVNIYFPTIAFDDADVYKITLPSADTMDRRRIYHGGYSTFLRMPETEGKVYHSDIIPTNLINKNITAIFNYALGFEIVTHPIGLTTSVSKEDTSGNSAVSLSLEWNGNRDGDLGSTAGSTVYGWGSGETWHLGSVFLDDINPRVSSDTPTVTSFPSSDVTPDTPRSGATQDLNTTVSGRSGYARFRTEYWTGAGSSNIAAFNQFWPLILIIS